MLTFTLRDSSHRSITRAVRGPVCVQPFEYDDPWMAFPDEREGSLVLVNSRQEVLGRLKSGDCLQHGELRFTVESSDDDSNTDRIVPVRRRRPGLAFSLLDGRRFSISNRTIVVGSHPTCDLVLSDNAVSGKHCEVLSTQGTWLVRDLGSTNGTWVGGARVPAAILSPGIQLTVGRTRIDCEPAEPKEEVQSTAIIGCAPCVQQLREFIDRYAPAPYPVLIEGESGSGKELVAREIHARSPRALGPMVSVNCGALAADVIESELFGHERGAFTGAVSRRRGLFEEAHGGTLFLDEIGELPLGLQPRLLRVLETGELRRVGGESTIKVNVRLVSATLRDLEQRMLEGHFREDLYFRIADFKVQVPALRERRSDIPMLVDHLLTRIALDTGKHCVIEDRALSALIGHHWSGNVREMLSVLKRAVFLSGGPRIGPEHIELRAQSPSSPPPPMRSAPPKQPAHPKHSPEGLQGDREDSPEMLRGELEAILAYCHGNISRASLVTGMARSTLRYRLGRSGA